MADNPKKYRLDRTAFQARNASEQVNYSKEYIDSTWQERIQIHKYLNSVAYGYYLNNPPRMDKSVFSTRSKDDPENLL